MSNVDLDIRETAAIVTFNRPDKKNALTVQMYRDATQRLNEAATNPEVRSVIITGAGGSFTSGNDLQDFLKDPPLGIDSPVAQFLLCLLDYEKPLLAAVEGAAVGIGATLLLHCDFVLASNTTKFAMPFVKLGLTPEGGSSYLIPLLAGHRKAAEILMLGDAFDAQTAVEIGLATRTVESGTAIECALAIAKKLSAYPPSVLVQTKKQMKKADDERLRSVMIAESDAIVAGLANPETQAAIAKLLGG